MLVSFRYAENVAVGDEVLIHKTDGMVPSRVVETSDIKMKGKEVIYYKCIGTNKILPLPTSTVKKQHVPKKRFLQKLISLVLWFYNVHFPLVLFPGAYVPLTSDGTILVNGVLASCYASSDHELVHLLMLPMTWFPEILEGIFSTEEGLQVYLKVFKDLGRWIAPASIVHQGTSL